MTAERSHLAVLQAYLHQHIPLSREMGVEVQAADLDEVILQAPLAPNINHQGTVFGGSAAAVATLAAWSLIHLWTRTLNAGLVVRRSEISYDRPMHESFIARCRAPATNIVEDIHRRVAAGRNYRVRLDSYLECSGETTGLLRGEFGVLPGSSRRS